jgi:hypothetical protein
MQKYLSIIISLFMVTATFLYVKSLKENIVDKKVKTPNIGNFSAQRSCARHPNFLRKLKIPQPIAIDLSQQNYKGLAFLYGQGMSKAVHLKTWERFDHFSTYALDPKGDMYLTPMPYISIKEKSFAFQKSIYRLDSNSGNLEIWMSLEEVKAGGNNPFGVIALAYDCDDNTLWVSAIDETDYTQNRGVIYHIDVATKSILQRVEGVDALSIQLVKSDGGKFLLLGGSRESRLYALKISKQKLSSRLITLLKLENSSEYIRKIKIKNHNIIELQTIPFSYTLIAATSTKNMRSIYKFKWIDRKREWILERQ